MGEENSPLWVVIVVGALSGVIGALVGPFLQRTFSRSDRALAARQKWAKEKLRWVFGIGVPKPYSDGPVEPFMFLVPPSGTTPQRYDMHTINPALEQSVDLMMLQPYRSRLARQWLYEWHFTLQPESRTLHNWMHHLREQGEHNDPTWEKLNRKYERRVLRVESALAIWATGQWVTHSSARLWISSRPWIVNARRKRLPARRAAPAAIRNGSSGSACDCYEWPPVRTTVVGSDEPGVDAANAPTTTVDSVEP